MSAESDQITLKPPHATQLWLTILMLVLSILYIETSHEKELKYNLFLSSNRSAVGAEVFIDWQKMGVLSELKESGMEGAAIRLYIPDGNHMLEIKKPGFQIYRKQFRMSGEDYFELTLSQETSKTEIAIPNHFN